MNTKTTQDSSQDCLLVLGMHRSGTSALSGMLSKLGYHLPTTLAPADHNNAAGYFESKALWQVNDDLFEQMGTGWNDWGPVDLDALPKDLMKDTMARAVDGLKSEFLAQGGPFVFKDPRICRIVPLWLSALKKSKCKVQVVHTHRNPNDVAASLARREGFDPEYGLLMWLRHVLDAEKATRSVPRAFTSYHLLLDDWQAVVSGLKSTLSLSTPPNNKALKAEIDSFLNRDMQHFGAKAEDTSKADEMPHDVLTAFEILERWADQGEDAKDRRVLDKIRKALDAQHKRFAPLVRSGQLAKQALGGDGTDTQADALQPQIDALRAAQAERDAMSAQMDINTRQMQINQRETDRVRRRHDEMESAFMNQIAAIARTSDVIAGLRASLSEKAIAMQQLNDELSDRDEVRQTQAQALDRIRAELRERHNAVRGLADDLRQQAEIIRSLRRDNAALRDAIRNAEGNMQDLHGSTSWRVTAPLRNVGKLLGRGTENS